MIGNSQLSAAMRDHLRAGGNPPIKPSSAWLLIGRHIR